MPLLLRQAIALRRPASMLVAVLLLALVAAGGATGSASAAAPTPKHNPRGRLLGIVPPRGKAARLRSLQAAAPPSNLTYHGGPVVHGATTTTIYWEPSGYSFPNGYQDLNDQFLKDVAADSGRLTNVYGTDTQYFDNPGSHIAYDSTFGERIVDTHPFPTLGGCVDPALSAGAPCLTDAQLQAELDSVVPANARDLHHIYFLYTPQGVGSCDKSGPGNSLTNACAYTDYCAYHSSFESSGTVLYANQPYADTNECTAATGPNANPANATINVVSHEHNETITDPLYSDGAWFDSAGNENGDKCAYDFGATSADGSGRFNQVINGDRYLLQQEWSNRSSGCALDYPPTAAFSSAPGSPTTAQDVAFDGRASASTSGAIATYAWTFGDGSSATGPMPTHRYVRAGTYTVRLTVTDAHGNVSPSTSRTVTVSDRPPTAAFGSSPGAPRTAQGVQFDGSASRDPDGTVTGYRWDFGDGTSDTGSAPTHTYAHRGTYAITLTVTDDSSSTATTTRSVRVIDPSPRGSLRIAAQRLVSVLHHGLVAGFTADQATSARSALFLDARTAHHLHLPTLLGQATGRLSQAGSSQARMRLTRGASAKLRRLRAVRVTVRLTLTNADGQTAVVRKTLVIRR